MDTLINSILNHISDVALLKEEIDKLKSDSDTHVTKSIRLETRIYASGWSNGLNTIYSSNITPNTVIDVSVSSLTDDKWKAYKNAEIVPYSQQEGSITFKSYGTVPTTDIPVVLIFRNDL